jgi:hydroxymethylbilane synthase
MTTEQPIRVGTRGSLLALTQTRQFIDALRSCHPGQPFEEVVIKTKGDIILDVPLSKIGDKGLFTKELEQDLLAGRIDLAVHSMKDMPGRLPEGLDFGVIPERVDPRDAFLSVRWPDLDALPEGARVGTSSLRRRAQLLHRRPDLRIENLRGNVDTRLRKLREGDYDAIILAAAGLIRLGRQAEITCCLPSTVMIPAVGQGALAIEIRKDAAHLRELLAPLGHPATALAIAAERAFLAELEGGCQVPLAGHATVDGATIRLAAMIASLDGRTMIPLDAEAPADPDAAGGLGVRVGRELLDRGGREILQSIKEGGLP